MPKSHRQIWLEIAEAYGTPRKQRTQEQLNLTNAGLCWAWSKFIGHTPTLPSYRALGKFSGEGGHWFKHNTDKSDSLRCLFACLFATMSEQEFDEVCR